MGKKNIVLGLFTSLSLILSVPYFVQAKDFLRVVRIEITSDGRFVPERILVKQDKEIIFRITALRATN